MPGVGEANSTNSKPIRPIGLSNRSAMARRDRVRRTISAPRPRSRAARSLASVPRDPTLLRRYPPPLGGGSTACVSARGGSGGRARQARRGAAAAPSDSPRRRASSSSALRCKPFATSLSPTCSTGAGSSPVSACSCCAFVAFLDVDRRERHAAPVEQAPARSGRARRTRTCRASPGSAPPPAASRAAARSVSIVVPPMRFACSLLRVRRRRRGPSRRRGPRASS